MDDARTWIEFFRTAGIEQLNGIQTGRLKTLCDGRFVDAFSHVIVNSLKTLLLRDCISIQCPVEDNILVYQTSPIYSLLYGCYGDCMPKFTKYDSYLIDSIQVEYLARIFHPDSLLQILTSIDENVPVHQMQIEQVSRLIQTNPARKEMFILALFSLYSSFILEHDDTLSLAKKYILIFRFLRKIESTGFFLQIFSQKFRTMFISKSDAVEIIVEEILEQSDRQLADATLADEFESALWMPEPVEAEYVKISKSFKYGDVFTIFINLYEGKAVFIEKFEYFLADKIINSLGSGQEEITLKKLDSMHRASVMLFDFSNSISLYLPGIPHLTISNAYWHCHDQFPQPLDKKLAEFFVVQTGKVNKMFGSRNPQRHLLYDWNLGTVCITVDFDDLTRQTFEMPPIYAYCLAQLTLENIDYLTLKTKILHNYFNDPQLATAIQFLYEANLIDIVEKDGHRYLIAKRAYSPDERHFDKNQFIVAVQGTTAVSKDDAELFSENVKYYKNYIRGFLANMGPMDLGKLYGLLQKFIQGPLRFTHPIEKLKFIMDIMIGDGAVVLSEDNNQYQLAEKNK